MDSAPSSHSNEIGRRERFAFGKNWSRFLSLLNEPRIVAAERSLQRMLSLENLMGKRFLDIGSGSGLFSLAARRLGAQVHSFDFDPDSVECTRELKRRYFSNDADWTIDEQSALNREYLNSLGLFDVVYSWGVLHHTGNMWQALENVHHVVAPKGSLYIAIYNDMGTQSGRWRLVKRTYNLLPRFLRTPFVILAMAPEEGKSALRALITLRPQEYLQKWASNDGRRGMSHWRDWVDWVGGYPYEVARPEEIFDFYKAKGFSLEKLRAGGVGIGCNEFVFVKTIDAI